MPKCSLFKVVTNKKKIIITLFKFINHVNDKILQNQGFVIISFEDKSKSALLTNSLTDSPRPWNQFTERFQL